ncbi:MAG: hypothetical protein EAZ99_07845 [Alphaproteobacteria bacterium]|nr:MAG: hypothetical protein EAZ99_07845 [Alphaproteobacteria bacterium]
MPTDPILTDPLMAEIQQFRVDAGLSEPAFGRLAVNDQKLFDRLAAGAWTQRTKDRLRQWMAEQRALPSLREPVQRFLAATGMDATDFGRRACRRPSLVTEINDGRLILQADHAAAWLFMRERIAPMRAFLNEFGAEQ